MIPVKRLVSLLLGVAHADRRLTSVPSSERKEVVHMTDYEMLSVIIAFGMLIVAIVALCKSAKK